MSEPAPRGVIDGVPASAGLAIGRVCFWSDPEALPRYTLVPGQADKEMQRLDEAVQISRRQLEAIRQRVKNELGEEEAEIFSAHNLLLTDPSFRSRVEKKVTSQNLNLEAAVEDSIEEMARVFLKISDHYMRERAADYRDVGRRVLDNLISYQRQCTLDEGEMIVLVARELMPSDTVHFHRQHIGAFVTERGGVSSHAAILARSLGLPAVVGASSALAALRAGDLVLVDGNTGRVVIDPSPEQIEAGRADRVARARARAQRRVAETVNTRDGVPIVLSANLTRENEAEEARRLGALGVGLLRTEFLFMDRGEFLDEEGQYQAYRHVVEMMAPHDVTIRTLDLGEDKHFDFENPVDASAGCVLGWRSLRLSLAYPPIFTAQIRAILRAAVHGPVRILLPMVTGVEEIRQVRRLIQQAGQALAQAGIPYRADIPVGAMIETPSAAVIPGMILQDADFLSVGTNDLVQYIMVADRTSERLHAYYRSTAPAILFLLERLARAADEAGKDISICGEIAGDPLYLPLLIGLGYRRFSVAPVLLPDLAETVGQIDLVSSRTLAQRCLTLSTADEVEGLLRSCEWPVPA